MDKTVLVTGAKGFIGRNLCVTLEQEKNIKVLKYDRSRTQEDLKKYVNEADFVFHLAGVNRPKNEEEFDKENRQFTEELLYLMTESGRKVPVAITSSIQASLDNPYGKSKKKAEEAIQEWSKKTGNKYYIYRLPNVFGKWCRPDYNSVVATFCHNIANGLPIQIHNPKTELALVYIDDVITELLQAMRGKAKVKKDGFFHIKRTFKTNLKKLSDIIIRFSESRKKLVIPNIEGDFEKFIYATYTSYLNKKNFSYDLEMKHDKRGWLSEFIKSAQFGQIFISRTKPGIARGNHWHHTKIEKFLVLEGEAKIRFRKIDEDEITEYRVSGHELKVLDIPAGYTHSIENIGKGELLTLFWADEIFNPEKPDTHYLEI